MIIDHEKVIDLIVNQLRDYATTSGRSSFIVGMNGDVGSSLVALLCKKTNIKTTCISVDIYRKEEDREAIKRFTRSSFLDLDYIEFTESFKKLENDYYYKDPFQEDKANKNLTSLSVLPALSTISSGFNGLIVGSRSKNDLIYRTYNKYGAGNADIFLLADLYKSEIIELFEYMTKSACYGTTYILDKEKNKYTGVCSACGKELEMERPKKEAQVGA